MFQGYCYRHTTATFLHKNQFVFHYYYFTAEMQLVYPKELNNSRHLTKKKESPVYRWRQAHATEEICMQSFFCFPCEPYFSTVRNAQVLYTDWADSRCIQFDFTKGSSIWLSSFTLLRVIVRKHSHIPS